VNDPVAETTFVEQLELPADLVGKQLLADSYQERRDEQVALVHQPGPDPWAARPGPATVMSRADAALICRTASGSNSRSIRVLALDTVCGVVEYTILSAAREMVANSRS